MARVMTGAGAPASSPVDVMTALFRRLWRGQSPAAFAVGDVFLIEGRRFRISGISGRNIAAEPLDPPGPEPEPAVRLFRMRKP